MNDTVFPAGSPPPPKVTVNVYTPAFCEIVTPLTPDMPVDDTTVDPVGGWSLTSIVDPPVSAPDPELVIDSTYVTVWPGVAVAGPVLDRVRTGVAVADTVVYAWAH